jgi:hypothetical protein
VQACGYYLIRVRKHVEIKKDTALFNATIKKVTYPLILITRATFGCPSTKKDPAALASLFALTMASSAALYSLKYFSALAAAAFLAAALSTLALALESLTA